MLRCRLRHGSVATVWTDEKLKHEQRKQDARKHAADKAGASWALSVVPQDMTYTLKSADAEAERWCRERVALHAPLTEALRGTKPSGR